MRWLSSRPQALAASFQRTLWRAWASVLARSHAQGLAEYGLILGLIAVVCVVILAAVGQTTRDLWYQRIIDAIP